MLKNTIIAILVGITLSQYILTFGDLARPAATLMITIMAFASILKLEDLWDKRQRILRTIHKITSAVIKSIRQILKNAASWIHWYLIQLKCWPIETAQRRRRRQMMQDYIRRIQDMQPGERYPMIEESEE